MKQSTKNFIGDVAKAVCAIGIVALCRRFGVKTSFTIGDATRTEYERQEPAKETTPSEDVEWPEAATALERKMLYLARSGDSISLTCSDRYELARRIYDRANAQGVSASEREYAAALLALYAENVSLTCKDRRRIIDMIDRL